MKPISTYLKSQLLPYLLPGSFFHFLLTLGYDALSLARLTEPLDQWLWSLPRGILLLLYLTGYLLTIGLFAWIAHLQHWHRSDLRWIVQTSYRRGLRIIGLPILDIGLLLTSLLFLLILARDIPTASGPVSYLILPLLIALLISLMTSHLLTPLDDIIQKPMPLSKYLHDHQTQHNHPQTQTALMQENNLDPDQNPDPQLNFGQQLKLPLGE